MVKDHSDSEIKNHIGYSFQLAARVLLYAPSLRQDSTYHSLCYTSRGALAGTTSGLGLFSFNYISDANITINKNVLS